MSPAESLFKEPYHQLMKAVLRSTWASLRTCSTSAAALPRPGGLHAEQQKPTHQVQVPVQELRQKQVGQRQLRSCNSDVHRAAFVLPEFAHEALSDVS